MKLGVLASHEGTTLQALIDARARGELDIEIAVVISNNSGAGALRRARAAGVPTAHLSRRTHPLEAMLDNAITETLATRGADWVLLAGYVRRLGPQVLTRFRHRILNTHPSLLPRHGGHGYFGRRVHEAVIDSGERVTGVTVHHVTDAYDAGPVIARTEVPVMPEDDAERLENRVKAAEQRLLVSTLRNLAERPDADGP